MSQLEIAEEQAKLIRESLSHSLYIGKIPPRGAMFWFPEEHGSPRVIYIPLRDERFQGLSDLVDIDYSQFNFSSCNTRERCEFLRKEMASIIKRSAQQEKLRRLEEYRKALVDMNRDHQYAMIEINLAMSASLEQLDRDFDKRAKELAAEGRWD